MNHFSLCLLAVLLAACGGSKSPVAPTPTPTPAPPVCQTQQTAAVSFENHSTTGKTYDVAWDGSKVATLAPTEKSTAMNVSAGVAHTLDFYLTGTTVRACQQATPILVACDVKYYYCEF